MERNHYKLNISMLEQMADNTINKLTLEDLSALTEKGINSIDLWSFESTSDIKHFLLTSIRVETIWALKKYNIKVNITHVDLKLINVSKQVKLNKIPMVNIRGIHYKDEYTINEGIEITGFNISKLLYIESVRSENIRVKYDDEKENLLINEIKKMNIKDFIKRGLKNNENKIQK